MALQQVSSGQIIDSTHVQAIYSLFKDVAGGQDSLILSSLSAIDFSEIPASSFLLPDGCVAPAKLSPTYESTWLGAPVAITTVAAAWTTALSLTSMSSGIWSVQAHANVTNGAGAEAAIYARLLNANGDAELAEDVVRIAVTETVGMHFGWIVQTSGTSGVRLQLNASAPATLNSSYAGGAPRMTYLQAHRIG